MLWWETEQLSFIAGKIKEDFLEEVLFDIDEGWLRFQETAVWGTKEQRQEIQSINVKCMTFYNTVYNI